MRFVCSFLVFSALVWGQAFQGSLRGRVTDPKDAVVPLAKVTLIEEATSVASSTVTNDKGEYSFPILNPSTYTLDVEAPGFKKLEQKGIVIVTQTANTQDAKLDIGQVTETINVTAEAELLDTSEASTGSVIDRQKMEDLPNLGRDPFMLARLSEGVVWTGNPKFDRMEDQSGQSAMSIAGGPSGANNYTLDGISITDSTNRAVIIPDEEAVQEMKVQANTYDASMGRTGGGTFNATLRGGTNRMHGSLFGTIRETNWLANTFFSNQAGIPILSQPFKNYGDSLGGPIRIPKLYDGRNKTFFFVTTEGYRMFDAATTVESVPTALERIGNFSQSLSSTKSGGLETMYDPMSTNLTTGARTPFANNIIPPSLISPIGLNLASYYPLPTSVASYYGQPNQTVAVNTQDRADQATFKVDHEFFPWLKASASYIHYGSTEPSNQWFQTVATPNQNIIYRHVDGVQANAVATLSPTTVLTVRFGQNRFPDFEPNQSNGFKLTTLGFPAAVDALTPQYPDFPSISMTGDFTSYGGGTATWTVYHSQSVNAEVSKFMGKHSLKAGMEYRLIADASETPEGPSSFSFSNGFTSQTPTKTVNGTGGALASMLLGDPSGGSITVGQQFRDFVHYYGFFIQDDYRVTPKLTLNFGFRGEHEGNPQEVNNKYLIDANLNAVNPLQASIPSLTLMGEARFAGVNGNPAYAGNPLALKAGPRFGFAYSMDTKTVFRGGYGIFWIPQSFSAQQATGYSQTTSIVTSTNNNYTPSASLSNPYPNGLTPIAGNTLGGLTAIGSGITATDPGNRSPGYVEQLSFDVQRQVTKNTSLQGGYIGSHTLDQVYSIPLDQLNPSYFSLGSSGLSKVVANPFFGYAPNTTSLGTSTTLAYDSLLTKYPEYTSVGLNTAMGRSTYYAFYGKGTWRAKYGLTLNFVYTWSRLMGLAAVQNYDAPIVPQGWTRGSTDQPNSYSMSYTYQLPFGKGQMLVKNANKFENMFLGGWQVQSQMLIHSGVPLSVTQTNANSGCNGCGQFPTATGVSAQTTGSVDSRITDWVNIAAFSQTPAYAFGNISARLNVYSPSLFNIDASMFKTVTFKEYYKVQFRAEALNVTNTVLFSSPASLSISSPGSFGQITSQSNFPRLFQISVRVTF
jgi:trimeric autotransporter adhesin